jgi:uncharacterized membrane protein
MNKTLKWVLIGLGIALVAFLIALACFRGFGFAHPMMGRAGGFERGFGGFGMGLMFRMGLRFLVPLGVLALAVVGIVALVRGHKVKNAAVLTAAAVQPVVPPEPEKLCAKCAQPVKLDWVACPYCGKKQ